MGGGGGGVRGREEPERSREVGVLMSRRQRGGRRGPLEKKGANERKRKGANEWKRKGQMTGKEREQMRVPFFLRDFIFKKTLFEKLYLKKCH